MVIIICLTAFAASLLTFFSGFGLGTILLPVMAIFFPVDVAVAMTGVVHLLNNLFKVTLVGRHAAWRVVWRFGLPAIVAAFLGARLLFVLPYIKQIVAIVMIVFAVVEFLPRFKKLQFDIKWLPLGGVISGFFGGLSGHQGAFRSAFLIRAGLSKEAFIATGVMIACAIDVTRLSVYASHFTQDKFQQNTVVLGAATASAFVGAYLGNRLLKKITFEALQIGVAIMIILLAIALGVGII
jgi:uncharacterized membrane protein YfcA